MIRIVLVTVVVIVLATVALWLLVRALEPRMAFFPMAGEPVTPGAVGLAFQGREITTSDGERLRAWWVPHPSPRAAVVYFHGNGGNLSVWLPVVQRLHRRGFSVFMGDYRGYGLSTGSPSERGLYRDVEAMLDDAWGRAPSRPVIYWGRSLGVSMAAYAARHRAPDGLVLEAGFPSARALTRTMGPLAVLGWFSGYRFPAGEMLEGLEAPALVIHGTRDSIIPFALGQQLHALLPAGTPLLAVEGGDHNDVDPPDPARYWGAIDALVERAKIPGR